MKICVVSQRIDYLNKINEIRDSLDCRLIKWILRQGFLPFPIPNSLKKKNNILKWLNKIKPKAIFLSGGNDLGEFLNRDWTEKILLNWAKEKKITVLGICRGMQIMSIYSGGKLKRVVNHCGKMHRLKNPPLFVNSFHNWTLEKCPKDYEVIYKADDNSIEGIKHKKLPWVGIMWHPERN